MPKEVIKAPIPAEHMELQQTFNAMIDRCKSAANNPVSLPFPRCFCTKETYMNTLESYFVQVIQYKPIFMKKIRAEICGFLPSKQDPSNAEIGKHSYIKYKKRNFGIEAVDNLIGNSVFKGCLMLVSTLLFLLKASGSL